MENLAQVPSSSTKFLLSSSPNPTGVVVPISVRNKLFARSQLHRTRRITLASALSQGRTSQPSVSLPSGMDTFTSISSSHSSSETSSIGFDAVIPVVPPSFEMGAPLFWIGVGFGISALFYRVTTYLKKYAMQQAFKKGWMSLENHQLNNPALSPGSTSVIVYTSEGYMDFVHTDFAKMFQVLDKWNDGKIYDDWDAAFNSLPESCEWGRALKKIYLDNPDVKQRFEKMGLTPGVIMSKTKAYPEVQKAYENQRVQAAIIDIAQNNISSITKYVKDKEVMDSLRKIHHFKKSVLYL